MIRILTSLKTAQNYFPLIHSFRIYYFLEKISTGKIFILEISLYFFVSKSYKHYSKKVQLRIPDSKLKLKV